MYVMFLNLIKWDISINTTKILKIDFGDPLDKIHLKRSEGIKSYRFRGMTHVTFPQNIETKQSQCVKVSVTVQNVEM